MFMELRGNQLAYFYGGTHYVEPDLRLQAGQPVLYTVKDSDTATQLYIDGTYRLDMGNSVPDTTLNSTMGALSSLLKSYYSGGISEIIVVNQTISSAEMAAINHYLAKKWGMTTTVDSDGDGVMDADDVAPLDATQFAIYRFFRQL